VATGIYPGFVGFDGSGIERIENLTVTQPNKNGASANFRECNSLKIATGTYNGFVSFYESGVEHIENLVITEPNNEGWAANFEGWAANFEECPYLKVATGTYPGFVFFKKSGIERIENLTITQPDKTGTYAEFQECDNLSSIKNWDLSKKIVIEPEKLEAEKERRALKKFHKETEPTPLPFL
jgi:hypothetical protein